MTYNAVLQAEDCSAEMVADACAAVSGSSPLDRQVLFSVYSHPHPSFRARSDAPCVALRRINPRHKTVV